MDVTVRRFHCDYRAAGDAVAPGPLELEQELRQAFAPALAEHLQLALGGDPAVYVIRRVDVALTLRADGAGLPELARRLAAGVTNAVLRTLAEPGAASGERVVAFADEAELVAQLIVDVLDDRAASRWHYAGFTDALARPRAEALGAVLMRDEPVSARALARIFDRGHLERLLPEIPASVRARLAGLESAAPDETLRPLVRAAVALLGDLSLDGGDAERLLHDYAATGPPLPDWRDRRSLADGVLAALAFLLVRRDPPWWSSSAGAATTRMLEAVAALDWLDRPALANGIRRLLSAPGRRAPGALPVSSASPLRLSIRQRLILRELAAACASGWRGVEVQDGDIADNRLRLRAALAARDERWAADPVAGELIGAVLRELAPGATGRRPLLGELAMLGSDAAARALAEGGPAGRTVPPARPGSWRGGAHSEHAGVALLVRAGLDLRVSGLGAAAGFLAPAAALPAALTALAGPPDAGLAMILGHPERSAPSAATEGARRRFEAGLLGALAARGLLAGPARVVAAPFGGGRAVFGGVEQPAVWPLAQLTADLSPSAPAHWPRMWARAVGCPPPEFAPAADGEPLARALALVPETEEDPSPADLTALVTGLVLVRAWGRWLPGLGRSSLAYLLEHFICRPGIVHRREDEVVVVLERRALDAVLELSGALADLDARRALGVTIRFELTAP